jgi:tripartite-type tricarboxylate transporter receptor subunit TctC
MRSISALGSVMAALAFAILSAPAPAQDFPTKPVRFIVPNPPGGASDITARVLAEKLSQRWGQPVVVENKPGAGAIIGTDFVAKAPPDGYTILLVPSSHAFNVNLYKKLPYDSVKDFAALTQTAWTPLVLVVNPSLPVKSVKELIAYAKANPGKLTYASSGSGTSLHLAAEMFKDMAGVDIVHVPYKGSTAAHPDVLSGQVSMIVDTIPAVLPHIKSGKLRPLAVTGTKRSALMPDLPTMAEAGLPGYAASSWGGVLAPAGTPKATIDKLNAEMVAVLKLPEVQERLTGVGLEPASSTPAEFEAFIKAEIAKWSKIIKEAGITAE